MSERKVLFCGKQLKRTGRIPYGTGKRNAFSSGGQLEDLSYKTSLNRSYYAIFHAMRAMNILKGFDSSKHSGVIAYFNKEYIKEGIMDKELSVIIKSSSFLREKSDYDDFFIVGRNETENQLASAKVFLEAVEKYLSEME